MTAVADIQAGNAYVICMNSQIDVLTMRCPLDSVTPSSLPPPRFPCARLVTYSTRSLSLPPHSSSPPSSHPL